MVYEEGTFDIGVSFGGGTTSITYSRQGGLYTRIGGVVYVNATLVLTNKGSDNGSALITGLPYTRKNVAAADCVMSTWIDNVSFANQFGGIGYSNSTTVNLWEMTEAGAYSAITDANFANDSSVIISGFYRIE